MRIKLIKIENLKVSDTVSFNFKDDSKDLRPGTAVPGEKDRFSSRFGMSVAGAVSLFAF